MPKRLYCGEFPDLQARFIADVSGLRRESPLTPCTVLVTGQLIRIALKRELARSGCAHANIRFMTLNEFAQKIIQHELDSHGLKLLPDLIRTFLLEQAIEESTPQATYFARLMPRKGFPGTLWKTLNDLRGAGLIPTDLKNAAENQHLRLGITFRQKAREIAAVWERFEAKMRTGKYVDQIEILRMAAGFEPYIAQFQPLFIYGIDELTEIEAAFLQHVTRDGDVFAYLPFGNSDAFNWSERIHQWYLVSQGFAEQELEPINRNAEECALTRIQTVDSLAPLDNEDPEDPSLLLLSAPGESREVEEITREVIFSPLSNSFPQRTVAVLLRNNDPYVNLLRESFARAGVPAYYHACQTLNDTISGRALGMLLKLADQQYQRSTVMDFLMSFPLKMPEGFPRELSTVPIAEWNYFSLQAGIVKGEQSWRIGLDKLRTAMLAELENDDDDSEISLASANQQLLSLDAFLEYLERLFFRIKLIASSPTWQLISSNVWYTLCDLIQTDDNTEILQREYDVLAEFDDLNIPLTLDRFTSAVEAVLEAPATREGRFQHTQPTVATLREAKGVLFDEVFIPGLVEKRFPQSAPQDPLLLDDERELLAQALEMKDSDFGIPFRKQRREQDKYLYHIGLNAAKQRVVLCYPRLDIQKSRDCLPSTFLLSTLQSLTGKSADYEMLDTYFRVGSHARRVPLSRLQATRAQNGISDLDYDMTALAQALQQTDGSSLSFLQANSFFVRGIQSEALRFNRKNFSIYEGFIQSQELKRRLAEWINSTVQSYSPTRMENYAECPFQYFCRYVLELQPQEEPRAIQQIDQLERGSLLHSILDSFYRKESAARRLPLQKDAWPRLKKIAEDTLNKYEAEQTTGLFFLWQMERKKLFEQLNIFFANELNDDSGYVPSEFEVKYEFDLPLDDFHAIGLRGRIDRIDRKDTQLARVIDYKTGKKKDKMKDGALCGGRALQLPVYRLAAESLLKTDVESAQYYYISDRGGWGKLGYSKRNWETGSERFYSVLKTILTGIKHGAYYPYPLRDACRNCNFKSTCGTGRLTTKWLSDMEQTADFKQMAEEE